MAIASAYQDHNGMTIKQRMFCEHYLSNDYNKAEAIKSSYGKDKSHAVCLAMASENLQKPIIKKYIEARMKEAIEKVGVGVEWRLEMNKKTIEACFDGRATKEGYINADGVYKGLDQLNKMEGSYAPVQTESKVQVQEEKLDNVDDSITKFQRDD